MIKANQKDQVIRIGYVFIRPTCTLLMEIPMYDETFNLYIEGRIHIVEWWLKKSKSFETHQGYL